MQTPLGYIEIERKEPWWKRLWWPVFLVCALYFAIHLWFWGIDRHMAALEAKKAKAETGFVFTGPEKSSGHGYIDRAKERGR